MKQIDAHTREGSLYYTDQWQAYATLKLRGDHVVIRREKGRPVGHDHINGIEGLLELRQELAVSLPRRAQQILPPLSGRCSLPLQPPLRRPADTAIQASTRDSGL